MHTWCIASRGIKIVGAKTLEFLDLGYRFVIARHTAYAVEECLSVCLSVSVADSEDYQGGAEYQKVWGTEVPCGIQGQNPDRRPGG